MKRSHLLLSFALVLGAYVALGFNDSQVKEVPTVEFDQSVITDSEGFVVVMAAEAPEIFVLPLVDLGYAFTAYELPAEKLAVNYMPVARPPPAEHQKPLLDKEKTKTIAVNQNRLSRAGYRIS